MGNQKTDLADARIEQAIWDIWYYVRENANSLDSERACKQIRAAIDLASADLQAECKSLRQANAILKKQKARLTKDLKNANIHRD